MRKKLVPIIIVAILLAAMVATLVILGRTEPVEEEASYELTESAYVVGGGENALTVSKVTIENATGTYTVLKKTDGENTVVTLEGREQLPLVTNTLSSIVSTCSSMVAKTVVMEGAAAADLAVYGLNNPRTTIRITAEEASPVLLVGDDAPGGEGAYIMVQGEDTVYLINGTTAARFESSELSFVDTRLTDGNNDSEAGYLTEFQSLIISGNYREEPIVITPVPEEEDNPMYSLSVYQITSPIQAAVSTSEQVSQIMASMFGLTADSVAGVYPEDLAQYGLEEPYSVLEVVSEEAGSFTLKASAPGNDGGVHLLYSQQPDIVYRINQSKVPWLEIEPFDLMSSLVILPHIDSVSTITVETPGGSHVFALAGEGSDLEVTMDGNELSTDTFRQFYQSLIAASYREQTEDDLPEEAPALRYTYAYRDGRASDVVSFYNGPARKYYLVLNDGMPYLTESTYYDRITNDLAKLQAGEEVKSYL